MKNTKKLLTLLLTLMLVLALVACGGGDTTCKSHVDADGDGLCDTCGKEYKAEKPSGDGEVKDVALITDGVANFKVIVSSDLYTEARKYVDQTLIRGLERKKVTIDKAVVDGSSGDTAQTCEILVGDISSRGDKYFVDGHSLGNAGYIIKIVDSKIIINGGSSEALVNALTKFTENVINLEGDDVSNVTMTAKQAVDKTQSGYKVTALKVNGTDMKGYTIATDKTDTVSLAVATNIQSTCYTRTGYWFDIVPLNEATDKSIVISEPATKVYGAESFKVYVSGTKLLIDCSFKNKLADSVSTFLTTKITLANGDVDFKGTVYTNDISVVYYSDFGAKGDGRTDDYQAIYDAHIFANECGQTVKATDGKTYLLRDSHVYASADADEKTVKAIPIMTNVEWGTAEFIIDDSNIHGINDREMAVTHVFHIKSEYSNISWTQSNHAQELAALGKIGAAYGTTKIDLGLGYPALLIIYNSNQRIYRRYGADYANNGGTGLGYYSAQKELIVVDKDGNIDPSTPFMFDYDEITSITIVRTDVEPITVSGGTITTRACGLDASYEENGVTKNFPYYYRGISVNRSHTTVDGVKHVIEGEVTIEQQCQGIEGTQYNGFFTGENADEVTFKNCTLQSRRYYALNGTYDFTSAFVNKIYLIDCVQSNFWVDEEWNPSETYTGKLSMEYADINGKNVQYTWGIGGTNFCKNMEYIGCTLSRFDAHEGLYNGRVENCTLQAFELIGKGDFYAKNVTYYSYRSTSNNILELRSDYGSTWEGTLHVDGFDAYVTEGVQINLVSHSYYNWYFGYTCYMPNLEVKNFKLYSKATREALDEGTTLFVYSPTMATEPYMNQDTTKTKHPMIIKWSEADQKYIFAEDTTRPLVNDNKITPPSYIKILNNEGGYVFKIPSSDDPKYFFANTKFYYSETDYYEGTNHTGGTTTFQFY